MIIEITDEERTLLLDAINAVVPIEGDTLDLLSIRLQAPQTNLVEAMEAAWKSRYATQGYRGTKNQADFFAGVMSAWHAVGMEKWCPPKWYVAVLRGDPIA